MKLGERIGIEAMKKAQQSSKSLCGKYVRAAIQRALGRPQEPTGIKSAKDFGPFLIECQYKCMNENAKQHENEQFQNGDAIIFQNSEGHPHGHIQLFYNGKWYSDFAQNSFSPYSDGRIPSYKLYRII